MKGFKIAVLAIGLSLPAAAVQAGEAVNLMLNWAPTADHSPFYYAKAQGWYEKAGIDLTIETGKGSGVERDYFYFPGDGFGMGLGLAVRTDPGNAKPPPPGSLGELKWDGAAGCYMVIDRKQDMFFVVLEQTPTERQRIQRTLKQMVYEALEN